MVSNCCICKSTEGVVANISFHSIPKKETQRQKWCSAIGREVTKRSFVCSKHFKESDFNYKVIGDTVRRFLIPGTIPSLLLTQYCDRESANIKNESYEILETNVNICSEANQKEELLLTQYCDRESANIKNESYEILETNVNICSGAN